MWYVYDRHSEKYPNENGQVRVLPMMGKTLRRGSSNKYFVEVELEEEEKKKTGSARWILAQEECPVECGGGED